MEWKIAASHRGPNRTEAPEARSIRLKHSPEQPFGTYPIEPTFCMGRKARHLIPMNEVDELVVAMATVLFAAVMLVAGGLYVERSPIRASTVPAAHMASAP